MENTTKLKLGRHAELLYQRAIQAAQPYRALKNIITIDPQDGFESINIHTPSFKSQYLFLKSATVERREDEPQVYSRILVLAVGKASISMAAALEEILDARITDGIAITKTNHIDRPLKYIKATESTHPVLSQNAIDATKTFLDIVARNKSQSTLIFVLLSGGASALMESPIDGVSLEDLQQTTNALLSCGANIHELNTIRKRLSRVKGGGLAEIAAPCKICSLILSDVIGDDLSIIGSGPTYISSIPSLNRCFEIVQQFRLGDKIPHHVLQRLIDPSGSFQPMRQLTIHPDDIIIGSNLLCLRAVDSLAQELGYNSLILTDRLEGEATQIAKLYISLAASLQKSSIPIPLPACIICGGETTVTLAEDHSGKGGRNQELALAVSQGISGFENCVFLSVGTDGTDNGPAAGAIVDGHTWDSTTGSEALRKHDSFTWFQNHDRDVPSNGLKSHIITGPTGTNVMDVAILLCE